MKTWRALLLSAVCLLVTACTNHTTHPDPRPADCPPPRQTDAVCPQVVVWAKDPQSGACCQYGTPCNAPEGWKTFYSEAECKAD